MGMEELTLLILISITMISIVGLILIFLMTRQIIFYYKQKSVLDYKVYVSSMGIKHYVDETLDEYITDSLEEIVTTDPKYIGKQTINSENEKDLLQKVVNQVIIFLPESFEEQMRKVYKIDIVTEDGISGLIDIVTRKAYVKIMALAVRANSMKEDTTNINEILNEN